MKLVELIEKAKKDEGILYNPDTKQVNPSLGYAVNVAKMIATNPHDLLDFFLNQNQPQRGHWIWVEKMTDGTWQGGYACHKIDIREVSVIAMMTGERSIWDCFYKKSIEIPEGQKSGTISQRNNYAKMRAEGIKSHVKPQG